MNFNVKMRRVEGVELGLVEPVALLNTPLVPSHEEWDRVLCRNHCCYSLLDGLRFHLKLNVKLASKKKKNIPTECTATRP